MTLTKNDMGLYETDIDGHTYQMEKWGAERALDTFFDLSSLLGKPLTKMLIAATDGTGAPADVLGTEIDPAVLDSVVEHLAAQLTNNRAMVMALFKRLGTAGILCEGKAITSFDLHYKDRLAHLLKVIQTALEVQYGDFFAAAGPLVGLRRPATASHPPQDLNASTG